MRFCITQISPAHKARQRCAKWHAAAKGSSYIHPKIGPVPQSLKALDP